MCPLHPRMLCGKFGWNWPCGSEEDFMYFHYYLIIFPWKRTLSFIWTNLNLLHPRMLCAKFDWNWLYRRRFLKFKCCIFTISLLSSLGKGHGPSFEQIWIPSTQGCFVPSLVELALWFWRRIFFNFFCNQ